MKLPISCLRPGVVALALAATVVFGAVPLSQTRAASCTPTGFNNLTATLVNPGGVVSGIIDATGCDIGVFYDASHSGIVRGANIFGAGVAGVVSVDNNLIVQGTHIHNIGSSSFTVPSNPVSHNLGAIDLEGSTSASGLISGNAVDNYGAASGIVVISPNVRVFNNSVSDSSSAPNSNKFGVLAGGQFTTVTASIVDNVVSNNVPSNNFHGIYIFGGGGGTAAVKENVERGNSIGIQANSTTNASISSNVVINGQTGILDGGTNDRITGNVVCVSSGGTPIDTSGATNPTVRGNVTSTSC